MLGALCLQVGALLATEAVKLVTGVGEALFGRILVIDGLRARQHEIALLPARATTPAPPAPLEPAPRSPRRGRRGPVAGVTFVDVREPEETATGVIPGARLIPLARLLDDPAAAGPGPVVVVCRSGARAARAAQALRGAGFAATVLAGGMRAWSARTPASV